MQDRRLRCATRGAYTAPQDNTDDECCAQLKWPPHGSNSLGKLQGFRACDRQNGRISKDSARVSTSCRGFPESSLDKILPILLRADTMTLQSAQLGTPSRNSLLFFAALQGYRIVDHDVRQDLQRAHPSVDERTGSSVTLLQQVPLARIG